MPRHPEPHIRRAVRVLSIVGELHKRGYQLLRVMPSCHRVVGTGGVGSARPNFATESVRSERLVLL
jgi:hypothetical protein